MGQPITFTAQVTPAAGTGTVQFNTVIGTATLSNGSAVFATSTLGQGDNSITAVYTGDRNVNGSQSTSLSYHVKH